MLSFHSIEEKWQRRWEDARIFEADPDPSRPKVFVTFPYPYLNGPLHLGHAYTCTKVDIYARFKRMQGYNVLFPQGWHATGEPIQGVAERVKLGDKVQIKILLDSGVPESEIQKFTDPKYIAEYYRRLAKRDMKRMGYSIDWRREFITTTLTPTYSRFIEWQYNTLRKKGYVTRGTHPVIWCPKCQSPTGDHDRLEGEGVSPIEYVLLKFRYNDAYLMAATLRPETIYGVTNMWINPDADYVLALVDGEKWIVSKATVIKLIDQLRDVKVLEEFKGAKLIGKKCWNPVRKEYIYILPAYFIDPETATGVVMSVPSHAPYDYLALRDLKRNPEVLRKFNIDPKVLEEIKPISIISVEGFGEHPAIEVVEKLGVRDQNDPKAEEATKEVYRREYHMGVMKDNCGPYAGMKVSEIKDKLIEDFKRERIADILWDPADVVICRCTTRCHVKILKDQWFLKFSDEEWKNKVREHLRNMRIIPEEAREAFEYTINWLKDKPCARRTGLGTPLPWDPDWIVETLSDSVIYMAYYTIAKHINKYKIPAEKLTDEVFDYIFLDKGNVDEIAARAGLDKDLLEDMKKEFEYWYPVDLRVSAKELVYNHLTFFLFHHVAIFRPEHWPRAIGVNGMIMVEGRKMSKRLGNFITINELLTKYGADVARFALAYCGEGLEDPDWRFKEVEAIKRHLEAFYNMATSLSEIELMEEDDMDKWLRSRLQRHIRDTVEHLENLRTRSAIQSGFFEILADIRWYARRKGGYGPAYVEAVETMVKLMAPVIPHLAEEIWEKWGREGFISLSRYPEYRREYVDERIELREEYIKRVYGDIKEIIRVVKIEKPKKLTLFVAPRWKYIVYNEAIKSKEDLIRRVMAIPKVREKGVKAVNFVKQLLRSGVEDKILTQDEEYEALTSAIDFLKKEFKLEVQVIKAEFSSNPKAEKASPMKPGILIE